MEEKMDLLLKNGLVVTENECKRVDIAVKNGKIAGLLERGSKTCCSEKEMDKYSAGISLVPYIMMSLIVDSSASFPRFCLKASLMSFMQVMVPMVRDLHLVKSGTKFSMGRISIVQEPISTMTTDFLSSGSFATTPAYPCGNTLTERRFTE